MAYSPEYSSPYSPQSVLPARFDHVSPSNKGAAADKENSVPALPIYSDAQSPAVLQKVASGPSFMNNEIILSDASDEQLIQQLQLNRNEKLLSQRTIDITDTVNFATNGMPAEVS